MRLLTPYPKRSISSHQKIPPIRLLTSCSICCELSSTAILSLTCTYTITSPSSPTPTTATTSPESIPWSSPGTCVLSSTTCPHSLPPCPSSLLPIAHTTYPSPAPLPAAISFSTRVNETCTSTSGSTGNVLWDGSVYLLRYLLSLPSSELSRVKGRNVLELGSGTGFLAAHFARSFECKVTATDLPYCKELVEGTMKANDLTSNCR